MRTYSLRSLTLFVAVIVCAYPVWANDPPSPTDDREVIERLRAAIRYEVEDKELPTFSIALVDHDRVIWAEGFGFQDAAKRVPATAETVYRVGSVSKLFTDIAVMQQVEASKLDLDTPVQEYLPNFRPKNETDQPITLRQLMSHQSGLVRESPVGHYFDPDEPTLKATVESLNTTALVYEPNTRTKYSNAGIAVVGAVLETIRGVSFSKAIDESILKILGTRESSFELTPELEKKLAAGWMWTYDGRRFQAPKFAIGTAPAGNLYASVNDLSRFMTAIFADSKGVNGPLLKAETLQQMMEPSKGPDGKPFPFGIGFHVTDFDGHRKIGHGGAVYGFSTQFEALPDRKLGVAAASALDGSNGVVTRLTDYALRLMLARRDGKPLPDYRTSVAIPNERIRTLVGTYRDGERFAEVIELNGRVFVHAGTYRREVRAASDDGTFLIDDVFGSEIPVELTDDGKLTLGKTTWERVTDSTPPAPPERWEGLIGEYGWDHNVLYILEDRGQLVALIEWFFVYPLTEIDQNTFAFPEEYGLYHGEKLTFTRDATGRATEVNAAEVIFKRREVGTREGKTFQIKPVKPVAELREPALAATPPKEQGEFRESDLVEVAALDDTIKLDIRYASENNFLGSVFYKQSRAFLQRPAAEAVVRAHRRLKEQGLGLMIHDAYRPWHVTKMFWDATPSSMKDFVANPATGSRHNRGCAVDLTLYDRATGEPIEMVAGYDEFSSRSFPLYPGGTSRQRWYRDLLRTTMEREGFSVYEYEWWHFDYQDWKKYRIGNLTFEEILTDADEGPVNFKIDRDVAFKGYDGKRCWVHARVGAIPPATPEANPTLVMTTQPLLLTGSDVFYALNSTTSTDFGKTWKPLTEQESFTRKKLDERTEMTVCDFVPAWHAKTGTLLGTGQTVWYRDNKVMRVRPRATAYSVYDQQVGRWTEWREFRMPDEPRFQNCGAGSVQRYDLPNGDILLPVSFKEPTETQNSVTVCRCRFDGMNLSYIEHGSEMTIDVKRGLYEPSLTRFGDRYFLTMRNDDHGYIATSRDGLKYDEPRPWKFDDGSDLGNYNTQQHWVTHSDGLFLIYTRKGADNDHVFRHRAPLFIARVDPERLVVIRDTERVLIPERGARLGNFGVVDVSPNETWVTVAEWMQTWGPNHIIPVENKHGADNSIHLARIQWNRPNRLMMNRSDSSQSPDR